jgi:hypothetical protein
MPQQWKLGKGHTTVRQKGATLSVRYHTTDVVKATPKRITLDTGGWFSNTTKTRMNQASHQFDLGVSVNQDKGKWYAEYKGKKKEFTKNKLSFNR